MYQNSKFLTGRTKFLTGRQIWRPGAWGKKNTVGAIIQNSNFSFLRMRLKIPNMFAVNLFGAPLRPSDIFKSTVAFIGFVPQVSFHIAREFMKTTVGKLEAVFFNEKLKNKLCGQLCLRGLRTFLTDLGFEEKWLAGPDRKSCWNQGN